MPKQTWLVGIDQEPGQTQAQFNPQSLQIANGDVVFWRNNTSHPHQVKPVGGEDDAWMDEIPAKLPDQDAPTSRQVTFALATDANGNPIETSATFEYVCAFHANETGTIKVA